MSATFIVRIHDEKDRAAVVAGLSTRGTVHQWQSFKTLLRFDGPDDAEPWILSFPGVRSVQKDGPQLVQMDVNHVIPKDMAEGSGQLPIISSGQRPGDRSFTSVWDLYPAVRDQAAVFNYDPTAGGIGDGTGVNLYVVDSGVDSTHPEFTGRYGSRLYDAYPGDDLWFHGTACATAAAGANFGVATGATIYDSRCFPTVGGAPVNNLIDGVDAAVVHFQGQSNPGVVSASWGTFGSDSYGAVIDTCINNGLPVFCSAGNEGQDLNSGSDRWPAEDPDAITVGAVDAWWRRLPFSNYGDAINLWGRGDAWTVARPVSAGSWFGPMLVRGTSFCAPMCAGVMARMLTSTTKMTSRPQVEALRTQFMDTYGVDDEVRNPDGSLRTGEKRLFVPGVSLTGFQAYSGPTRFVPDVMPITVDFARTHAILGAVPGGVSTRWARTHVILEE